MNDNTVLPGTSPASSTIAPIHKGYSEVNGLKMYYEICGNGRPLLLIHGGGSNIVSTFGKVFPLFGKSRKAIAVELQAHGRTSDRQQGLSFEQDADDVAALIRQLDLPPADIFGFSNGATTALHVAIRHPQLVRKLVLGSPLTKRSGIPKEFWEFMPTATLDSMPAALRDAHLRVSPDPSSLQLMHERDVTRMTNFKDIPDEVVKKVKAPALIINGDRDVITTEHVVEIHRLITGSRLMIIPGGHGEYIGEVSASKPGDKLHKLIVPIIENFLDEPEQTDEGV